VRAIVIAGLTVATFVTDDPGSALTARIQKPAAFAIDVDAT